jgi:hypothetical protein
MDHLGVDPAQGTALAEGTGNGFIDYQAGLNGVGHDCSPWPLTERILPTGQYNGITI